MENIQDLKKMDYPIELDDEKIVKNLIATTESGMYATTSNDGENVIVYLSKNEGMNVHFYQSNGWIREDSYNSDGFKESETFVGRYDKTL